MKLDGETDIFSFSANENDSIMEIDKNGVYVNADIFAAKNIDLQSNLIINN